MSILSFNRSQRLLVVERDGFGLRAAVVRAEKKRMVIEQVAISRAPHFNAALVEAVEEIRKNDKSAPRRAILLAPEVVPALLELPVDPKNPRPTPQMEEMIRWEMEPYLDQEVVTRSIGAILIGRGYLSLADARRVLERMEEKKSERQLRAPGERRPMLRFGEAAIELELIDNEQLEECLKIQESFQWGDDEYVCGWTSQPRQIEEAEEKANKDRHAWLACGLSRGLRERWRKEFAQLNLSLEGIYPLTACSAAALNGEFTKEASAVLDFQAGMVGCTRLSGGTIEGVRVYHVIGNFPSLDVCCDMVGSRVKTIWLSGRGDALPSFAEALSARLSREVQIIPCDNAENLPEALAPESVAGWVGAVRHVLCQPGVERAVCIPAADPPPPVHLRVAVWWGAVIGLTLLVIGAVEGSMAFQVWKAEAKEAKILQALRPVEEKLEQINAGIAEVAGLQEKVAARYHETELLEKRKVFLTNELPHTGKLLAALLEAVARAVTKEVVIDRMVAEEGDEVEMGGWALSERAVQQFSRRLASVITADNLEVADVSVRSTPGRLGMRGYAFDLKLVPLKQEAGRQ